MWEVRPAHELASLRAATSATDLQKVTYRSNGARQAVASYAPGIVRAGLDLVRLGKYFGRCGVIRAAWLDEVWFWTLTFDGVLRRLEVDEVEEVNVDIGDLWRVYCAFTDAHRSLVVAMPWEHNAVCQMLVESKRTRPV